MEERLQKILARSGYGSRRECEDLIFSGRVRVNGQIVHLGDKADPNTDQIVVDGAAIPKAEELVYIALYKPRGVISTLEAPDPRPTVRDLVPIGGSIYPVGRLDVDSEGLILLTNDGELANLLTHPRYGHEKEYRVLVARTPDPDQIETWRRGIVLADGHHTAPADVQFLEKFGKGTWLRVTLREGRKRQIRETGSLIGLPVVRIIRTRIGSLRLGALKPREWRHLTIHEVGELKGKSSQQGAIPRKPGQHKVQTKPTGPRKPAQPSRSRHQDTRKSIQKSAPPDDQRKRTTKVRSIPHSSRTKKE